MSTNLNELDNPFNSATTQSFFQISYFFFFLYAFIATLFLFNTPNYTQYTNAPLDHFSAPMGAILPTLEELV